MLRPFRKQVFIGFLQEAGAQGDQMETVIGTRHPPPSSAGVPPDRPCSPHQPLGRDPIPLALLGSVILMVISATASAWMSRTGPLPLSLNLFFDGLGIGEQA